MKPKYLAIVAFCFLCGALVTVPTVLMAVEPVRMEWEVAGVQREAVVFVPEKISNAQKSAGPPLVFGFHGHGGNANNAARSFGLHKLWPEAVVVYMQGLPTPGRTDPEGKKNGWQNKTGEQADRDLKFFDAVLKSMQEKHGIDTARVYSTGHSNGGGFTYTLWTSRWDVLAAVAPCAAGTRDVAALKPLPCLHIAGKKDAIVPFVGQELVMRAVRRVNGCSDQQEKWEEVCTKYPSATGTPFVAYIHDGNHKYPDAAPALIVKFFQQHQRRRDETPGTK